MKKIEAYLGLDGQIYGAEGTVMEADEKYIIAGMVKDFEALFAEKKAMGTPSKVFATYRGKVREIYERWERMVRDDVVEVEEGGERSPADSDGVS